MPPTAELLTERLDLPPAPTIPDGAYLLALLDAMVTRGWTPELLYDPCHREWTALLRGPAGAFHRNEHRQLVQALLGCVARALTAPG